MERDHAICVLEREARRILVLAGSGTGGDLLARSVPSCPDWTFGEVVKHLGNVYNWAGTVVEGRLSQPPRRDALPRRPEHMSSPEWMSDRLDRLVVALSKVPEDADVWTFSSKDPTAAFWWRRQAHETLIHRVDAEAASKVAVTPVEPPLAADNIDELFELSFTDAGAGTGGAQGIEPPASIHLHAEDLEGAEWTVDTRNRSVSRRHAKADVALRGSAWALSRWCWGRPVFGELECFGDVEAAETWRKSVVS
jgi:uncharacterized protein (TIGR03083 family)